MRLVTCGSISPTAYLELSGIRNKKTLHHNPFIIFRQYDGCTKVEIVDSPEQLLRLPARTKVMAQWSGERKSEFVNFTVGQFRKHLAENPKHAGQAI